MPITNNKDKLSRYYYLYLLIYQNGYLSIYNCSNIGSLIIGNHMPHRLHSRHMPVHISFGTAAN